jgi:hypothetical protein
VVNATDPTNIIADGGFAFSKANGFNFNAPNTAICSNPNVLTCTARSYATVMYLNYQFSPLDNIPFRPEFFDDMEGQRTTVKTRLSTSASAGSTGSRRRSKSVQK